LLEKARFKLRQRVPELGRTLGEELLEPTRIYAKITRRLFTRFPIKGVAHITGGGIAGNLPRVLPKGRRAVIERGSWPVPVIFRLIQRLGRVEQGEMDRTFNNGLGLILVVGKNAAEGMQRSLRQIGEESFVIGEIRGGLRGASLRA
jgi:phosphoribosylformylglycinamidine cyclo-ligase